LGIKTVDASVAKLAPCLKSEPIDWRYGLRKGSPRALAALIPNSKKRKKDKINNK
jgi:hypothetical protein